MQNGGRHVRAQSLRFGRGMEYPKDEIFRHLFISSYRVGLTQQGCVDRSLRRETRGRSRWPM